MALKTFVVTVSNPGVGNRYYIDGVQQDTLELVYGQTYRFDQSDASNATHPLKISATSNGTHGGGTEYTTNVTIVGTPGSAGAYTEIDPVAGDAPRPLFYYCQNHSGMGGQMDPSGDTWGALNWGEGEWSDQGNAAVDTTSAGELTTNIDSVSTQGDADVSVDGLSLTPVIDSPFVTANFEVGVSGLSVSMDQGDVVQTGAGTVAITVTFGLNTEVGQETEAYPRQGWGRDGWGIAAWGIDADEIVEVAGFTIASGIGSAVASIDVDVTIDSQATIGTFIGNEDAFTDVTVSVDGQGMTTAQGDAIGFTSITIEQVGLALTGEMGNSEAGLLTEVLVTGINASFALPGEVIVTDSVAKLTGVGMNVIVDGNHRISAWKQVDTGEQVIWSTVDQAA